MNTIIKRTIKRILAGQRGQALPIVLCALAIGGLTIAGSVNYATTNVISSRIILEDLRGTYAAEAGIEETLWNLLNGNFYPTDELTGSMNRMTVSMETGDGEEYTVVLGDVLEPGQHSDYIAITGNATWDDTAGAYKYVITVTSQHQSTIHITDVGARLPPGYSYQEESAAISPENLSNEEPDITTDSVEAFLLNWEMAYPLPLVDPENPVETQTFYLSGNGSLEGEYAWLISNRGDIGGVGEITGVRYFIISEAAGETDDIVSARLEVDTIISGGVVYILSWQINN
ncbi:hypothetical protein ACFLYQ_01960 [Chloroflexota bacterium]